MFFMNFVYNVNADFIWGFLFSFDTSQKMISKSLHSLSFVLQNIFRSFFAFHLASEHHKFYMKLRNSFVSLKSIADDLNIPIITSSSTTAGFCSPEHQLLNQSHSIEIQSNENKENMLRRQTNETTTNNNKSRSEPILNEENLLKLEKQQAKAAGKSRSGEKICKKSMLNDGRLLKLKHKFLKRSKSSVEMKVDATMAERKTKEENQNKENECPRVVVVVAGDADNQSPSSPRTYKINRNKVKMGTRVFSTQFLNKSLDNIYDSPLDLYLFDGLENSSSSQLNQVSYRPGDDDGVSMKSTSVGSIYFSNQKTGLGESGGKPESCQPCVIRKFLQVFIFIVCGLFYFLVFLL